MHPDRNDVSKRVRSEFVISIILHARAPICIGLRVHEKYVRYQEESCIKFESAAGVALAARMLVSRMAVRTDMICGKCMRYQSDTTLYAYSTTLTRRPPNRRNKKKMLRLSDYRYHQLSTSQYYGHSMITVKARFLFLLSLRFITTNLAYITFIHKGSL